MTDEQYIKLKEDFFGFVKHMLLQDGGIQPCIVILGQRLKDLQEDPLNVAIAYLPVPSKYMKSEDTKEQFVTEVLPQIASKIREEFSIRAVAWVAEAWMRMSETPTIPKDWMNLPIQKEVVIISLESKADQEVQVLEIKRNGKQVNADGELVDDLELIPQEGYKADGFQGRFSGLYKKFAESGSL